MKNSYSRAVPYVTKDGSEIRELMHPDQHGNRAQSLAEARVPAGGQTLLHQHTLSEEIYYVTDGSGLMRLGEEEFAITVGDVIDIPPGMPHNLRNTGKRTLVVLCACSPAYNHADTVVLGE